MAGKAGKVWGETEELLRTPLVELHRIRVVPNSQCSLHKHENKWNLFYVIEGELLIDVEKNDYELVDTTVVKAGEWATVRPNEYHRFRARDEGALALEIYYLEPIGDDIIRKDVGSLIK